MGLFSRNESASKSTRRNGSRGPASSDAQAKELRGRARRRLVGALVLVVAAIIVLPMLFDNSSNMQKTPLVTQVTIPPAPPANAPAGGALDAQGGGDQTTLPVPDVSGGASGDDSAAGPSNTVNAAPQDQSSTQADTGAAGPGKTDSPEKNAKQQDSGAGGDTADTRKKSPDDTSTAAKSSKSKPGPKPGDVKRTDDGSVALALLQGRTPDGTKSQPEASENGDYVLQIAAYTTNEDAQSRRAKLVAAGVTNAYVERAQSSGKTVYRLRVGPFATRDSAQAAQARLRALGYDNGFISSK